MAMNPHPPKQPRSAGRETAGSAKLVFDREAQ